MKSLSLLLYIVLFVGLGDVSSPASANNDDDDDDDDKD